MLAIALLLVGCPGPSRFPPGAPTGALAVRVEVVDGSGYRIAANPKVLGDVLSSVSFTIDGPNVPEPVTKSLVKADWTNSDGSYKAIATSFTDLLPGDVAVSVTGVGSSKGLVILSGSQTLTIVAGSVVTGTLTAQYLKGDLQLGLNPNGAIPQVK